MKYKCVLLYVFICLFLINQKVFAAENTNIPDDAVEFNGHFYKLYELSLTWEDAQEYFENIGGHLATITSPEENRFIFDYIISLECRSAYFGATDNENEGTWVWVTGEKFVYSNWHDKEPNNEGGDENYAMFYYKNPEGTWNDGGIRTVNANLMNTPYICEWDNINEGNDSVLDNENVQHYLDNNTTNNTNNNAEIEHIPDISNKNEGINSIIQKEKEDENAAPIIYIENLFQFQLCSPSIIGGGSLIGGSLIGGIIAFNHKKKRKHSKTSRQNSSRYQ